MFAQSRFSSWNTDIALGAAKKKGVEPRAEVGSWSGHKETDYGEVWESRMSARTAGETRSESATNEIARICTTYSIKRPYVNDLIRQTPLYTMYRLPNVLVYIV